MRLPIAYPNCHYTIIVEEEEKRKKKKKKVPPPFTFSVVDVVGMMSHGEGKEEKMIACKK